jgi:hypothetical protein
MHAVGAGKASHALQRHPVASLAGFRLYVTPLISRVAHLRHGKAGSLVKIGGKPA